MSSPTTLYDTMDLLLTGAAGFLGSHVLLDWLRRHPDGGVMCLGRASQGMSAPERISAALEIAAYECGIEVQVDALMRRVKVVHADLDDPSWSDSSELLNWTLDSGGYEVIHGAANLSFRAEDRPAVWRTNVGGTEQFLRALRGLPNVRAFNYLSTAYVAGDREGEIAEALTERPERFNNVYEESKWVAEHMVAHMCTTAGIGYRILRPSIVIGHSQTHRISAKTGFYKVVETLMQLSTALRSRTEAIILPFNRNAGLNLIPIDLFVLEMMDLIAAGEATTDKVFHLTNERPISLADLFYGVSPLTGVLLATDATRGGKPANATSALVHRSLRHYTPYFRYSRAFDRSNVWAAGASHHQREYWLDLVRLREFVQAFIAKDKKREEPALASSQS